MMMATGLTANEKLLGRGRRGPENEGADYR